MWKSVKNTVDRNTAEAHEPKRKSKESSSGGKEEVADEPAPPIPLEEESEGRSRRSDVNSDLNPGFGTSDSTKKEGSGLAPHERFGPSVSSLSNDSSRTSMFLPYFGSDTDRPSPAGSRSSYTGGFSRSGQPGQVVAAQQDWTHGSNSESSWLGGSRQPGQFGQIHPAAPVGLDSSLRQQESNTFGLLADLGKFGEVRRIGQIPSAAPVVLDSPLRHQESNTLSELMLQPVGLPSGIGLPKLLDQLADLGKFGEVRQIGQIPSAAPVVLDSPLRHQESNTFSELMLQPGRIALSELLDQLADLGKFGEVRRIAQIPVRGDV